MCPEPAPMMLYICSKASLAHRNMEAMFTYGWREAYIRVGLDRYVLLRE